MANYLDVYTDLTEVIGDVDYCKLNVTDVQTHGSYIKLVLGTDQVLYRTDYTSKERDRFPWTPAENIDSDGDPTNAVASILYIIHDTNPVSWDKAYIQYLNETVTEAMEGEELRDIISLTLWTPTGDISCTADDHFYLFKMNDINGLLGSWEAADEAKIQSLTSATKVVTTNHPVYFCEDTLPTIDSSVTNGYAWAWKYDPTGESESQLFFHYGDGTDAYYASSWAPVHFTNYAPPTWSAPAYWYNWADLASWDSATLYCLVDGSWVKATSSVIKGTGTTDGVDDMQDIPYDIEDTWDLFGTVYNSCRSRDRLYQGYTNYAAYTVEDILLTAGNYYFIDDYGDYYVFSVKEDLQAGATLTHDRFNG